MLELPYVQRALEAVRCYRTANYLSTCVMAGAALASIGVPKDSVLQYETALKADEFLVTVHGSEAELARARTILAAADPASLDLHHARTPVLATLNFPERQVRLSSFRACRQTIASASLPNGQRAIPARTQCLHRPGL